MASPVLDTHVFLWMVLDSGRLSKKARRAIETASRRGGLTIASISLWEIAQLAQQGRLRVAGTVSDWLVSRLDESGVGVAGLDPIVADLATAFGPDFPKDPADRLIAATARASGSPLITADESIRRSPLVECIW
jgi:PIN domain nuclease of toxin-antitoxin system